MLENHYLETISQEPKLAFERPTIAPKQGRKYKECHKLIKVQFTLGALMDLNDEPLPSQAPLNKAPSKGEKGKEEQRERTQVKATQSKTQTESQRAKGTNYKV
jgi:hypothetical protein